MTTMARNAKRMPRKISASRNPKRNHSIEENVFSDLFNMVEDIFGPDIQKSVTKKTAFTGEHQWRPWPEMPNGRPGKYPPLATLSEITQLKEMYFPTCSTWLKGLSNQINKYFINAVDVYLYTGESDAKGRL